MDDELDQFEYINRKLKLKTRKFLTSGGKEYVSDGRPGQHSPFVRKLLEAIRSYGGDDSVLSAELGYMREDQRGFVATIIGTRYGNANVPITVDLAGGRWYVEQLGVDSLGGEG